MTPPTARSTALNQPARALLEYRDSLVRRMQALPLDDRRRGRLADQIRQIEATIDRASQG